MSELSKVYEIIDVRTDQVDYSEPIFPTDQHQELYRDLVDRMETEASILPGMGTAVGMIIRRLARDYVWGVVADQAIAAEADPESARALATARRMEKDSRMMGSFKLLMDQAMRADLEHALRTEFVIGLVKETVRVLDAEVDDKVERVRLKELLQRAFVTYTESVQGRIGK